MPALLGLLQLLFVGALATVAVLIIYTAWSLLHPPKRTYAWALSRGVAGDPSELDEPLAYEPISIQSNGQTLRGWLIKGHAPSAPRLVLVHGWGSSSIGALKRVPRLASVVSEIITLDLPGHGESTGTARMGTSEHLDINTLLSSLDEAKPTVLYGWSMGAGIAMRAAVEYKEAHDICGVIAESPYIHAITPARNVIRLRGLPIALNIEPTIALLGVLRGVGPFWNGFARDKIAASLQVPLLLIHGSDDPVCPIDDSKQLQQASKNTELVVIEHAGHNNIWTVPEFSENAGESIQNFMQAIDGSQFPSPSQQ
ncbi:MAG: alpha/beta hydrolase [Phycisphaerales bacterium]